MFAYVREQFDRSLVGSQTTSGVIAGLNATPARFTSDMSEAVHTFIVSSNVELVPNVLDLKLSYAYALADEDWTAKAIGTSSQCSTTPNAACQPFPTMKTNFQSLDATARYRVDTTFMNKLGWNFAGETFLKFGYRFERNSVANWQNDMSTPYLFMYEGAAASGSVREVFMAANNPNYNVHLVRASMQVKW